VVPPVSSNYTQSFEATTALFSCYLRHVLGQEDAALLHPLSAEWGEVLRAGQGTLQTQATIYCIAVEPLLRMIFTDRPGELQRDRDALAMVKRWTRQLRKFMAREGCPEHLQKRFDGLFAPLAGLSDRERLAHLASLGAVDRALAERWQRLRPVSAHGSREGQGDTEPLFQDCMAVLGLLYQLVAHLIGLKGWLTNLGAAGWPLRPYPLATAATLVAEETSAENQGS
jgi:hypothetical protein